LIIPTMATRPPPARDLPRLLAELSSDDAPRREGAAARLIIMGNPATTPLAELASASSANAEARRAALRALNAIDATRATRVALLAVDTDDEVVALDAMDVLGTVAQSRDAQSTLAFERLTELALDSGKPVRRRLAALAALEPLSDRLMMPIYETLALKTGQTHRTPSRGSTRSDDVERAADRSFFDAATRVGDLSGLEALAAAWVATPPANRTRRDRLAAVFSAIITRERVTRDHPALSLVLTRFPAAGVLVASAPKPPRRRPPKT
jgi:hypothetical protein